MSGGKRLAGGTDPESVVVRVGDTVRRPSGPWSGALRALLTHLADVGFTGAPRFLGTDELGRDVLTFIEGDVPLPPYPSWALSDGALDDLGRLLRDFHEATRGFDPGGVTAWSTEWADPRGGPVVCHNDVYPENVVFRDGRPVAMIDLTEAAPGRPLWDLAIAAQEWCPLHAPEVRLDHPADLDGVRRFGVLVRAYGIEPDDVAELLDVIDEERSRSVGHIRAEAAAGNPAWARWWAETDGEGRAAADSAWLAEQRPSLVTSAEAEGFEPSMGG